MGTNKTKKSVKLDEMTRKNNNEFKTIKPNEKKSLVKIAKKVAEDHKGDQKPTLLVKKSDIAKGPKIEKKDKYHIWDVYGVKYFLDDKNTPTRRTSMIEVTADHDTANEPELRNKLIAQAEDELGAKGFFMTDNEAMDVALKETEPVLDTLRHDIKYGEACQKCAAERIGVLLDWLEYLRGWRDRRTDLAYALGGESHLPPVIPNDYRENWHLDLDQHRLVPNVEKPKVEHSIVISGTGPKDLEKALESLKLPKETLDLIKGSIDKSISSLTIPTKQLEAPKNTPKKK